MRRASDLEQRLVEWGKEYGGGRYGIKATIENGVVTGASYGDSPLASMMKWHGRPPDGLGYESSCTAADEVHDAVKALIATEQGWVPSEVLRCEYWLPGQPLEMKLQKLRYIGNNLGRTSYYKHLRTARIFVAGALGLRVHEEDQQECAA